MTIQAMIEEQWGKPISITKQLDTASRNSEMVHYTLKDDQIYDGTLIKLAKLIYHIVYVVQQRFENYEQIETILRNSLNHDKKMN